MTATQIMKAYYLIQAMYATRAGNCDVNLGDGWTLRVNLGLSLLILTLIYRYRHADGTLHPCHDAMGWEQTDGTLNLVHLWLNKASEKLTQIGEENAIQE
jgi:predicted chitinase